MIVGIELGKKYAQVCVKNEQMEEPESISLVAGSENYRIPVELDIEKKSDLQEVFRKLWKLTTPYGTKDSLEYLVFCLEEPSAALRESVQEVAEIYDIPREKVRFVDKKECFCVYVLNQSEDLMTYNALLIENKGGIKEKYILLKRSRTTPVIAEVRDITEKTLRQSFFEHRFSSVFLLGDDFEEEWMKENLALLKNGKRVFAGKNLFVKGACYKGMELKAQRDDYLYLGDEKVRCNIALKANQTDGEEYIPLVEGGKNWYESNISVDVLLLDEPEIEFVILPINGGERTIIPVALKELPERPKKTTRLRIFLEFLNSSSVKLNIKDLGFGELFPASDMNYEGELQWEQ